MGLLLMDFSLSVQTEHRQHDIRQQYETQDDKTESQQRMSFNWREDLSALMTLCGRSTTEKKKKTSKYTKTCSSSFHLIFAL